jgi:hypothetical protein
MMFFERRLLQGAVRGCQANASSTGSRQISKA